MHCDTYNVKQGSKWPQAARRASASRRSLVAVVLCAVFVAVMFLSATYIFAHADHMHNQGSPDGQCTVCVRLTAARDLLALFAAALAGAGAALVFGRDPAAFYAHKPAGNGAGLGTLVRLKVRLNN